MVRLKLRPAAIADWPEGIELGGAGFVAVVDPYTMTVGIVALGIEERAEVLVYTRMVAEGKPRRRVRGTVRTVPAGGEWGYAVGERFDLDLHEVQTSEGDARAQAVAEVQRYLAAGRQLVEALVGNVSETGVYGVGVDGVRDEPADADE
jgi:hypothetical protein